ncbi:MAG: DUF2971 domain-containing protein [Luteolibacter sp.]
MENDEEKSVQIFYPECQKQSEFLRAGRLRLVHYTSADAAFSIIKSRETWLRNSRCMNDFMEVEHGIECIKMAMDGDFGNRFRRLISELFPGTFESLDGLLTGWLPHFRSSTYITSVSEHLSTEDKYGRLSMWRAYGGDKPVAVVLNTQAFSTESDALKAYTYPVTYVDDGKFCEAVFGPLVVRMEMNRQTLQKIGADLVKSHLFEFFKSTIFCTKHPGFSEEREWRVVYNPTLEQSDLIVPEIRLIKTQPEKIYKIQLSNYPDRGLDGMEIPQLIHRVIIGPRDGQSVLAEVFVDMLREAGCTNPEEMVVCSGIPLR